MDDERLGWVTINDLIVGQQHAKALDLLDERIRLFSPNALELWMSANCLLALGRTEEAIYRVRRIGPGPNLSAALLLESRALSHLGRLDEALVAATEAARLDPDSSRTQQNLAAALIQRQDRSALEPAQRAVAADPSDPEAHYLLAGAHVVALDRKAAQRSVRRALKLDPGHRGALAMRASLKLR